MNEKKKEPIRLSTTITPEFDKCIRHHSYTWRMDANKILEMYQASFLRELAQEKKEKIKAVCDYCGIKNYLACMYQAPDNKTFCFHCKK